MDGGKLERYRHFRKTYPSFVYRDFSYTESDTSLDIAYRFEIPGLAEFRPSWSIPKPESLTTHVSERKLSELVFSLGMTELISYWKLTCSPNVRVECGTLAPEQIMWWKKLYAKGLGEFFYTNGIPFESDFMHISCSGPLTSVKSEEPAFTKDGDLPKVLVPVGGGKDSAVTLELLKSAAERYIYIINPRKATLDTAAAAGLTDRIAAASRKLDANMLALNAKGFLNGHTPFSAVVAFSSVITAYLNGIKYAALSNESSANEATVADTDINHQYSKSYEFERDFRSYEAAYIGSGVSYFSFLRPLSELKIAELFASFSQYHDIFRSCNAGSKTDIWCGNCPKCLFVYILLSPFLDGRRLEEMFGKNLLNDSGMTGFFEKLTGLQPEKPFECVGSRDEVKSALYLAVRKFASKGEPLPLLLRYYNEKLHGEAPDVSQFLDRLDENHSLPPYFLSVLNTNLN